MMSGELALMPRSDALAGVNPALGVSVGSRQFTHSLSQLQLKKTAKKRSDKRRSLTPCHLLIDGGRPPTHVIDRTVTRRGFAH